MCSIVTQYSNDQTKQEKGLTTQTDTEDTKKSYHNTNGILREPNRYSYSGRGWLEPIMKNLFYHSLELSPLFILFFVAIPCIVCQVCILFQIIPLHAFVCTALSCFLYSTFELLYGCFFCKNGNDSSSMLLNRRVQFAPGTKFYRLPRPLSHREKQYFIQQRFKNTTESAWTSQSTFDAHIINVENTPRIANSFTRRSSSYNISNTDCAPLPSPSKLIGGDSPMARIRNMSNSQLQESYTTVSRSSPSKMVGGDSPMMRMRLLRNVVAANSSKALF